MKHLWPLLLLGAAFFVWNNKSCTLPSQLAYLSQTQAPRPDSLAGPVRQWEHEVTDMPARERALPQPGGLDAHAVLDSARQGLAKAQ